MGRIRPAVGTVVLLVGLLIALSPFISVWRVGGQMLSELPDLEGVDHRDERVGWSAMFDDEFVLARRAFDTIDDRNVAAALVANGFEPLGASGFTKGCCGDYDAVWADVQSRGADGVLVELTAADSDWQLAWPLFSGIGSLAVLVGAAILVTGGASRHDPTVTAGDGPPPPARSSTDPTSGRHRP